MRRSGVLLLAVVLLGACAAKPTPVDVLAAPPGVASAAEAAMIEGNRLFRVKEFDAARTQYERALAVQPSLAEAHYNLARTLEYLGDPATAREHYLEAANLAPGHKVIWDSPPLRPHGEIVDQLPPDPGSSPTMSPLGGFGGTY